MRQRYARVQRCSACRKVCAPPRASKVLGPCAKIVTLHVAKTVRSARFEFDIVSAAHRHWCAERDSLPAGGFVFYTSTGPTPARHFTKFVFWPILLKHPFFTLKQF
jgi:hypothetical protein